MGLIFRQVERLLSAHRRGIPTRRVLMIGHQGVCLHPAELKTLRKTFGIGLAGYQWGEYADRLLQECLGAEEVDVLDYSDYEGANILHDLSQPIPESLKSSYDLVIEAGTLEHIFNFPVAVANVMQMVRVGGTLNASTVANNLCGHGFYQFSPELIFRVFTPDNGFEIEKVYAMEARYPGVELSSTRALYEVIDPAKARQRVGLQTNGPVMLLFEAVRRAEVPIFRVPPLQSDYVSAWAAPVPGEVVPAARRNLYRRLRHWIGRSEMVRGLYRRWIGHQQRKEFSFRNQRLFKKVDV